MLLRTLQLMIFFLKNYLSSYFRLCIHFERDNVQAAGCFIILQVLLKNKFIMNSI